MARREQGTRSIRLPGGGGQQQQPQQRQQRPAGPPPSDDVGRAMADLDASAQIRDRSQLPSKVKVITPQVIMNIVQAVTDKFGMDAGIDREEFNHLVMQQTQMEMRLQQAQDKVETYKGEYKKVYDAYQQAQELLQQAQAGNAGNEQFIDQYEQQIAEMQQRNAQAVDTYMDLQQQLDSVTEQYGALEAALQQRDDDYAQLEQQLIEAQQGGAAADDANAELEQLSEQLAAMEQQLVDMENASAEANEGANQAERERDELNGQLTALQSELEDLRGQLDQASAGANEESQALSAQVEELKKALKLSERSHAKVENMEIELEKLRSAEGDWLEEKRRLASQLSNETNNRRAADEKLKAIEKGETLPEAAKAIEERAKKAETEAQQLKDEVSALKKDLDKAKTGAAKADSVSGELEKTKSELEKSQSELKKLNDDLGKAGNAAKELGMLKRKFENVEAELEGLRTAEGKWLEEKRRLAAQLSNETNMRRELEAKMSKELDDVKAENESVKKKSKK